jgi:hypothetical protein
VESDLFIRAFKTFNQRLAVRSLKFLPFLGGASFETQTPTNNAARAPASALQWIEVVIPLSAQLGYSGFAAPRTA